MPFRGVFKGFRLYVVFTKDWHEALCNTDESFLKKLLHYYNTRDIILGRAKRQTCRKARRYALMWDVATQRGRELLRSMSDFKPGETMPFCQPETFFVFQVF